MYIAKLACLLTPLVCPDSTSSLCSTHSALERALIGDPDQTPSHGIVAIWLKGWSPLQRSG